MKTKNQIISTQEKAQKQVMSFLADIYYDRQSISWDNLKAMALVLYKYQALGPNGTKEVALYLYKIYGIVKTNYDVMNIKYQKYVKENKGKQIRRQELYVNKEGKPLSLNQMDDYTQPIYRDIAILSKKMRNCIQDKSLIDNYIKELAGELIRKYINLTIQKKIDSSVKSALREETEELNEKTAPEDIFRQIKVVKKLWEKNDEIKKSQEEKTKNTEWSYETAIGVIENFFNDDSRKEIMDTANALLERLNSLCENTSDGVKKQLLVREIVDFRMDINGGNIKRIQTEIARLTENLEMEESQIEIPKR